MFCRGSSFTEGRNEGSLVRQPTRPSYSPPLNTVTSALGLRASADLAAVRFARLGQRTTEMLKLGFSLKGLRLKFKGPPTLDLILNCSKLQLSSALKARNSSYSTSSTTCGGWPGTVVPVVRGSRDAGSSPALHQYNACLTPNGGFEFQGQARRRIITCRLVPNFGFPTAGRWLPALKCISTASCRSYGLGAENVDTRQILLQHSFIIYVLADYILWL